MQKVLGLTVLICGIHMSVFASAGICTKCEKIREYNRAHPSKYTYYEDYLKDKEEEEEEASCGSENDFNLPDNLQKKPQNPNHKFER